MSNRHLFTLAAAGLLAAPLAHAEDEKKLGWSGNAEAGYNAASGNSDTSNFKADANARHDWAEYALEGTAKSRVAKSDDIRSEESYFLGLQGDLKLNDIEYLFAAADYTIDKFSGYDYQASQTVGYGRTLYKTEKHDLKGQLGLGLRESETEFGETETEVLLKPELEYAYAINDYVTFTENLKGSIGTEYGVYESETGIKSNLSNNLFLKASYTVRHTTDVPVDRKKTDTFTGISLGYSF
ncbi:MAG: DUF481 domain-containing protein [Alphaproteobacteria bacterium]|nr:MAG: DUF481 domain-containing protein [Alphaproteobacteria bacterium]